MAIQRFEHVMAPEGTVDAMRELVEEAVSLLQDSERPRLTGSMTGAEYEDYHEDYQQWKRIQDFLDKARAALGDEADRG